VLSLIQGAVAVVLAAPLAGQQSLSTWSLDPELRLGSLDGPYALGALGSVVVSPKTGNVFVNEDARRILEFDSAGTKLHAFGHRGDGPGEFRNLSDLYWSDGHIIAFDAGSYRVSRFTEEGELVDSRRIESDPLPRGGMRASPRAPLGPGYFVGQVRQPVQEGQLIQHQIRLLRMDGSGNDAIIDQFPDAGRHLPVGSGKLLPIPMLPGGHYAVDPQGSELVIVHQYEAESADAGTFRVRKMGADGRLMFSRSYRYAPSPIPEGYIDEFLEVRRDGIRRLLGLSTREAERLIDRYLPEFMPPIRDLLVATDGSIWLRRRTENTDDNQWWVLNERGELVARLRLPRGIQIRHVGANTVWGVETDELGVNYLVRYRIVRQ
jgi:hypothetical protein